MNISAAQQGLNLGGMGGGMGGGTGGYAAMGGYGSFPEAKRVASAYTPEQSTGSLIYR